MPTIKQRNAVDKIIENHGNISKSMKQVGYAENSAINPSNLTKSKGFAELMNEYGLTDQLLLESLVFDIKNKPKNRKQEIELGAKLKGRLKDSPEVNLHFRLEDIFKKSKENIATKTP
jgi:hypothetical protein